MILYSALQKLMDARNENLRTSWQDWKMFTNRTSGMQTADRRQGHSWHPQRRSQKHYRMSIEADHRRRRREHIMDMNTEWPSAWITPLQSQEHSPVQIAVYHNSRMDHLRRSLNGQKQLTGLQRCRGILRRLLQTLERIYLLWQECLQQSMHRKKWILKYCLMKCHFFQNQRPGSELWAIWEINDIFRVPHTLTRQLRRKTTSGQLGLPTTAVKKASSLIPNAEALNSNEAVDIHLWSFPADRPDRILISALGSVKPKFLRWAYH